MKKIGLVLEGGGMRGAYTAAVLKVLDENNFDFNYIMGVSAGASAGANIVSEQIDRNREVFVERAGDKETAGLKFFLRGKGYLNMEYLYFTIPNEISPFDFEKFKKSDKKFVICLTDAETGEVVYVEKSELDSREDHNINNVLKASSSLPIISSPTKIDGKYYYDGGVVDSIPIKKAMEDGYENNVVILTRTTEYRKKKQVLGPFRLYLKRRFPNIIKKLDTRHEMYNNTVEKILELEKEGKIFVFRPQENFDVARLERDVKKLEDLYSQGYKETEARMEEFKDWLEKIEKVKK